MGIKPILVTCYVDPDLDGLSGAVGYAEYLQKTGKNAVAGIIGEPHDEARFILDRFGLEYPQILPNADDFDDVILVDASDLNGLVGKIRAEQVIEIIDHRKIHEADKFPRAKAQIELVGAAASLVAEKFMLNKVEISKRSATLLYGAILSNTLNFKNSVTTERDKTVATWLNGIAKLPEGFWKELFEAKSDLTGPKLQERIEGDFAHFLIGGKKIGIAQIEIIGAAKLIAERGLQIVEHLEKIRKSLGLDMIFQTTIELEECKNYLVASDSATQQLLEKALQVRFNGILAVRPEVLMRKQIVPLLKEVLE